MAYITITNTVATLPDASATRSTSPESFPGDEQVFKTLLDFDMLEAEAAYKKPVSAKLRILAVKTPSSSFDGSYDKSFTGLKQFVLDEKQLNFTSAPILSSGYPNLSFTEDRPWPLPSGNFRKAITISTSTATANHTKYTFHFPALFRWEYWKQLIVAGTDADEFYVPGDPQDGKNHFWYHYDTAGWSIVYQFQVDVIHSGTGVLSTEYQNFLLTTKTYSSNSDYVNTGIVIFEADGSTLVPTGFLHGYQDNWVRALFTKVQAFAGDDKVGAGSYSAQLWIEPYEGGGRDEKLRICSLYAVTPEACWKSVDGSNKARITFSGQTIYVDALIDYTKLLPATKYTIYCRLYNEEAGHVEGGTAAVTITLTNGEFSSDGNTQFGSIPSWAKVGGQAGCMYLEADGGKLKNYFDGCTPGSNAYVITQKIRNTTASPILVAGTTYKVTWNISAFGGSGSRYQLRINVGGAAGASYTSAGVKTDYITCGSSTGSGVEVELLVPGASLKKADDLFEIDYVRLEIPEVPGNTVPASTGGEEIKTDAIVLIPTDPEKRTEPVLEQEDDAQCCFSIPVLASAEDDNTDKNDKSDVYRNGSPGDSAIVMTLQKMNDDTGVWADALALDSNNYVGTFYALGFITDDYNKKATGYLIEWRKVLMYQGLGEGRYRIKTVYTTLTGATVTEYSDEEYCLSEWASHLADGTVRIETVNYGVGGDPQKPLTYVDFGDYSTAGWYGQIRLPGKLLYDQSTYSQEFNEYNDDHYNLMKPVINEQQPKYTLIGSPVPGWMDFYLSTRVMQADTIHVTDYNNLNRHRKLIRIPVKTDGPYKPMTQERGVKLSPFEIQFAYAQNNLRKRNS